MTEGADKNNTITLLSPYCTYNTIPEGNKTNNRELE
jgi:hypothetical protein